LHFFEFSSICQAAAASFLSHYTYLFSEIEAFIAISLHIISPGFIIFISDRNFFSLRQIYLAFHCIAFSLFSFSSLLKYCVRWFLFHFFHFFSSFSHLDYFIFASITCIFSSLRIFSHDDFRHLAFSFLRFDEHWLSILAASISFLSSFSFIAFRLFLFISWLFHFSFFFISFSSDCFHYFIFDIDLFHFELFTSFQPLMTLVSASILRLALNIFFHWYWLSLREFYFF